MSRFTADHMAFAASKTRYMGREESIEFLKTLNIQLSVGHWSAGDFCDRFAPPGYHSDDPAFKSDFEAQCRRMKAAGVDAIEIHQSVFEKTMNGDLDMRLIERAQDGYLRELGMTVSACNINVWTNPKFRLGGPCNPDPAIRRAALDEMLKGLEICKVLEIEVMSVWPGSDGADYHFQIDYKQSLEWFTEALVTLNSKCLRHGIKRRDRAEALRAARAVHDHPDGGVGHRRRAEGQPGVRRQQLRPDDRLRPPEDGGDDGVDRVRSGGVRRRARAQVRHQRRAAGPQRPGPDVRHDLDSRVGRVPLHDVRARTTRAGTARISSRIARTRPARSSAA